MLKTRSKFLIALLSLTLATQYSCKKDTIQPVDSSTTSEQIYSISGNSITADIIQTSDGGYIMLGTSYATNTLEGDIVAIKTNSEGIEEWSTSMGKPSELGTGELAGQTIKYHEEGVKIVEEADGSFSIAGNITYYAYANSSSTNRIQKQAKVVLYKLSTTGAINRVVELRPDTEFTDKVSDFKIGTSDEGLTQYILTGYTTNISPNKPGDSDNGNTDLTDILTIALDEDFNLIWSNSNCAYGFSGQDYGTSIQIIQNGYLITGTSESTTSTSRFIAVIMDKSSGTPTSVSFFTSQGCELEGGYSVYDASNQLITIVGNVTGGTSGFTGQLVAFQIKDDLIATNPNPSNSHADGFEFINPTARNTAAINNTFKAASIALIPDNGGFAISSTSSNNLGKDICITKLNNDFSLPSTGWPHYYGSSSSTTQELAGPVLPSLDLNGTVKYAYTGTFNANTTNSQIGWVLF